MWSGCCADENPASRTVGGVCDAVKVEIEYGGGVEGLKKLEEEGGGGTSSLQVGGIKIIEDKLVLAPILFYQTDFRTVHSF